MTCFIGVISLVSVNKDLIDYKNYLDFVAIRVSKRYMYISYDRQIHVNSENLSTLIYYGRCNNKE